MGINAEIAKVGESQGLLRSQPDDLLIVGRRMEANTRSNRSDSFSLHRRINMELTEG